MVEGKFSDHELAVLLKKESIPALNRLYKIYYRSLYYFACQLTRDEAESEDIVAESYIKLWEKRSDFDTLSQIKAFLFIVTKNACLNYIKRSARHTSIYAQVSEAIIYDEEELFLQEVESEVLRQLYHEIETLPKKARQVFKLIFFEGKQTFEIAEQLHISKKTVLNQKLRAIALLQTALLKRGILFLSCVSVLCN
jgi:RNA polymerase sigma-70 factor (family 1)